ncbi:hypothetical protein KNV32_gp92 [uncultured phage cr3_1]|uniref:Uncharacterized protein n=1 Tax=uncultured phage cr3_1 TaxID=2772065 RepID=A0A7M1RWX9_9CAUD|nr:hypothetical protein KNV32_gp92 [uncultured phage cr3_1]QOR58614.1 hypothetical protein [uncultured phage cr3_1]
MIWLLFIICIVITLSFFENLMMMVANYITYTSVIISGKTATENQEQAKRQNNISSILTVLCALLWTLFIYLWN